MIDSLEVQWVTKSAAAEAVGVPLRTVQNWAKDKKIRTRGRLVALEDVEAQAGGRAEGGAGATNASVALAPRQPLREMARGGANGVVRPQSDGELSARLLKMFEDGSNPIDASIELKVPLERVRALHLEWKRAKEENTSGPSVSDRLATLEGDFRELQSGYGFALTDLNRKLVAADRRIDDAGFPPRSAFKCAPCGVKGYYSVVVRCTCCGKEDAFGFLKPEPSR